MPNGISALPSWADTSMPTAVIPVTAVRVPYMSRKCRSWPRSRATSSSVCGESGAVAGMTWMIPVSPLGFGVASGTDATPGSCRISAAIRLTRPTGSVLVMMSAVTINGPLYPGPKCSLITS